MKKFAAITVAVLMSLTSISAHAEGDSLSSAEITSTIQELVPTALNGGVENPDISGSIASDNSLNVTAAMNSEASKNEAAPIEFLIPNVSDSNSDGPGRTFFQTLDGVPGVIQELMSGFKVVRVIDSPTSLEQAYELNLSGDTALEHVIGGYLVSDATGVRGFLAEPWAIDSSGVAQPTLFELDGNTLRQKTEPADAATYPIVADPNWMYSYTYPTRTSPNTNWIKLHNCFNCYFPIGGAPALWPEPNQLLPLITYGQNMECRMGTVIISGLQDYSWMFRATANHVDGYGSYIYFFLRYVSGVPSLIVTASIVNDPAIGKEWMRTLASAQWQTFATNLGYK